MQEDAPYTLDAKTFERFDQRRTVFGRMLHDAAADYYRKGMYGGVEALLAAGRSRLEFARVMGAWSVYDHFHGAFSWEPPSDANSVMERP